MPTFHLICGLPCSGKTTVARRLEVEERALYLSPDPWMAQVVRDGYDAERREAVKAIQLELAGKALRLGVNVVPGKPRAGAFARFAVFKAAAKAET
jgi:predicted kinase